MMGRSFDKKEILGQIFSFQISYFHIFMKHFFLRLLNFEQTGFQTMALTKYAPANLHKFDQDVLNTEVSITTTKFYVNFL